MPKKAAKKTPEDNAAVPQQEPAGTNEASRKRKPAEPATATEPPEGPPPQAKAKAKANAEPAPQPEPELAAAAVSATPEAEMDADEAGPGPAAAAGPLQLKALPVDGPDLLKIVSWNVNGLNACMAKPEKNHLKEYVALEQPDILCLQETKMNPGSEPRSLLPGYEEYWNCGTAQKGYAGTALFTRVKPLKVTMGIGEPEGDAEGRAITAEFARFFLVTTYVPNSGMKLERLSYRTGVWDKAMLAHLQRLQSLGKPVVWCGDLNVAHAEIDLANPKTNKRTPGFTPAERQSFSALIAAAALLDSWRALHPAAQEYTFYSYKRQSREKNIGWRLDYFVVSAAALPEVRHAFIRQEVFGSDHVPLGVVVPRALVQ